MTPHTDLAPLLAARMKRAGWPLAMVATVVFLGSLLMGFLSFAARPTIAGRILLIAFAVLGLAATTWLIVLIATGTRRSSRLIDLIQHHREEVERIYAGHVRNVGLHAAHMDPVPAPEAEHMNAGRRGWHVIVTRRDPTRLQRFFGLNFDAIPVRRDEVLPLLEWLRAEVPSAAGPPELSGTDQLE